MTEERERATIATRAALAAVLVLAALLRLWQIGEDSFGTPYYAAGVRSMTESWRGFFFAAFDPGGFVSVDKPPVAFWLQAASVGIFGYRPFAVLLPQALEGIAAVAILHHLVARRCGRAAGLLAALFLAVTPVAVAVDRSGNTDSALVLLLLLAAWATVQAAESARWSHLILAALLGGIAFNVKMAAAFVAAPALALLYLVEAPLPLGRRLLRMAAGAAVGAVVALAWVVAYDLTPPDQRPYAGSSHSNSMLELAIGHNARERFSLARRRPVEAPPPPAAGTRLFDAVPPGPLRLADRHLAQQAGWLLPLALAGLLAGAFTRRRRPEALLWGGWAVTCAFVYSAAGGIFHAYYLSAMAPPLAALAAIGVVEAWRRDGLLGRRVLLPAALVATAAWQVHLAGDVLTGAESRTWIAAALAGAIGLAALVLVLPARRVAAGAAAAALLLVAPLAWAATPILAPGDRMLPSASLARLLGERAARPPRARAPTDDPRLVAFLQAGSGDERFVLAVPNARLAAPLIIRAGLPVAAIGGFMGSDPIVTPDELTAMAAAGRLRFVLIAGRGSFGLGPDGELKRRDFARAARAVGTPVPAALWRSDPPAEGSAPAWRDPGYAQLWDLRPKRP
ncbi:MAG: glycosyltransferase family 39 protein [Alphaproteobacteria bacterium]